MTTGREGARSGWQQPPVRSRNPRKCVHFGAAVAAMTLSLHPEGHEWICSLRTGVRRGL